MHIIIALTACYIGFAFLGSQKAKNGVRTTCKD